MKVELLLISCLLNSFANGARILGVFIFPSYSHSIIFRRIYQELAIRGHEVIVFTTDPSDELTLPNLREVDISFAYQLWRARKDNVNLSENPTGKEMMKVDFNLLLKITEELFQHPEFAELIANETTQFDVALSEWLFPSTFAFGKRFNCPLVGISSMDLLPILRELAGTPTHPVFSSNFLVQTIDLNLWNRIMRTEFYLWLRNYFYTDLLPACDKLIEKYLGKEIGPLEEVAKNVSMIIVTKNPLLSPAQPNTHTIKEISGMHVQPPKPLPHNLRQFLDESPEGVVYFSLGSNIKSEIIADDLKETFLQAFAELPYNILWKFEEQNFTNLPENVRIESWLPQQDILAHPNVKVFITQGGLQSLEEAIRRKVPMVGMPFFVDQPMNIRKIVELEIGLHIEKKTLTKNVFKSAIREVAENPKYKRNIEIYGDLLEDQPIKPIDQVIYWIEYVIRHKGAPKLRSNYGNIPWYQYLLLDIISIMLACLLLCCSVIIFVWLCMRKFLSYYFKSKCD